MNTILHTKLFHSAHLTYIYKINNIKCAIYGHNKIHNNIANFGGLRDNNETLKQCIIREVREESLNTISKNSYQIINYLNNPKICKLFKSNYKHKKNYSFYLDIDEEFDFENANKQFLLNLESKNIPNWNSDFEENDMLVAVPLSSLRHMINKNENIVKDIYDNEYIVRDGLIYGLCQYFIKN